MFVLGFRFVRIGLALDLCEGISDDLPTTIDSALSSVPTADDVTPGHGIEFMSARHT